MPPPCRPFAAAAVALAAALPASGKPTVVLTIVDDLGYNDLGAMNGNKTLTPHIDAAIADGVFLSNYHTWKLCAPSRASIQTGRYPWGIGFYDMQGPDGSDSHHCVDPRYKMIGQLMREAGYATHFTGKWDVGRILKQCTPTERGYDSFLGYYTACTNSYWYHGTPGKDPPGQNCGTDFSNSTRDGGIAGAAMSGAASVNGTYDRELFTARAVGLIEADAARRRLGDERGLFVVVAFHNVHDACPQDRHVNGLNAPCEDVARYPTTELDTWKVQAAMTTQLDYGFGNITAALQAGGSDWAHFVVSDNGGPLDHSSNYPLRAGKASNFEGGYRVVGFVHSPLLPPGVRGTRYPGLLHAADLYKTLVEGVAGHAADWNATGPRPPDSFNVWPQLRSGAPSPRSVIVHAVVNAQYFPKGTTAMTWDDGEGHEWKLILGQADKQRVWQAWPTPGKAAVPFGLTSGSVENGTTTHCVSGLLSGEADAAGGGGAATPLLYDLLADPGERRNLAGNATYADVVSRMTALLAAAGAEGPPPAIVQHGNKTADAFFCSQARATGYLEPLDWRAPWPTPGPTPAPPAPAPTPAPPPGGYCAAGVAAGDVCCAASCGSCGGPDCGARPGGGAECCVGKIRESGRVCGAPDDVACVIPTHTAAPALAL